MAKIYALNGRWQLKAGDRVMVNDLAPGQRWDDYYGLTGIVEIVAIDPDPCEELRDECGPGPLIWAWVKFPGKSRRIAFTRRELDLMEEIFGTGTVQFHMNTEGTQA